MAKLKYKMAVKRTNSPDSELWIEEMEVQVDESVTAQEHAEFIVSEFNRTLKPGESERTLVSVN